MKALQSDLAKKILRDEERSELLRKILCSEAPNVIYVDDVEYVVFYQFRDGRLQEV